jgi:hypothetical protein
MHTSSSIFETARRPERRRRVSGLLLAGQRVRKNNHAR